MELSLLALLAKLTSVLLPVSILFLPVGIALDFSKSRFHWSKYALILLGVTIVLLVLQISWTYQVVGDLRGS
jgi:hypothetical protein